MTDPQIAAMVRWTYDEADGDADYRLSMVDDVLKRAGLSDVVVNRQHDRAIVAKRHRFRGSTVLCVLPITGAPTVGRPGARARTAKR